MISENQARKYCYEIEKIENYEEAVNDKDHKWDCHHRCEILPCGRYSMDSLKKFGLYYNRPASELVFLRHDEHASLHKIGSCHTEEVKHKISVSNTGKKFSELHRNNLGEAIRKSWRNGKRNVAEQIERQRHTSLCRSVRMMRISDGMTKVFYSSKEGERWLRENGYPRAACSHISVVANKKPNNHTCYGAKWEWVE